jgi:two-component system chemotaxis sensor kinase CheA
MGDQALTADETDIIQILEQRAHDLAEQQLIGTDFEKGSDESNLVTQPPSEMPVILPAASDEELDREIPEENADAAPDKAKNQEEFIRIAESKIESVIAQVGELFEANLKIESLVHEFAQSCIVAEEVVGMLDGLRENLEGTQYESVLNAAEERARNLSIRLCGITNRFDRDERQMAKLIQGSQEELHKIRLAPVSTTFVMIRRQVREISKTTGKPLELYLSGGEYALDRKVLDAMEEPIAHILRNAADHGIEGVEGRKAVGKRETGRLSIAVHHTGDAVELTVTDDGKGIDPEAIRKSLVKKKTLSESEASHLSSDQLLDYLFESGFSTHSEVSKISGRGVGLDVVKYTVERLGGEVRLETQTGEGTAITLRLPLVMSTLRCLLFKISNKVFAIPASNVEKVVIPRSEEMKIVGGGEVVVYDGQNIPLGSIGEILNITSDMTSFPHGSRMVVIISFGERRLCFAVDELMEYTQIILKPLGDLLERVPNVSGITLLGSGEVALILNPADLVRAAGGGVRGKRIKTVLHTEGNAVEARKVLVVDDSITTRTLEKTLLESAGFTVYTASDGYKALDILSTTACDVVISDIQMPNMDGIELTRAIKGRPAFSYLPVILITALGSDQDKAKGLAAGADAYIIKRELTQRELINTINQLL